MEYSELLAQRQKELRQKGDNTDDLWKLTERLQLVDPIDKELFRWNLAYRTALLDCHNSRVLYPVRSQPLHTIVRRMSFLSPKIRGHFVDQKMNPHLKDLLVQHEIDLALACFRLNNFPDRDRHALNFANIVRNSAFNFVDRSLVRYGKIQVRNTSESQVKDWTDIWHRAISEYYNGSHDSRSKVEVVEQFFKP